MHRILGAALAAASLSAGSPVALAAPPQPYTLREPGPPQPTVPPKTVAPSFSIFGIPVVVSAPVAKPYCNCTADLYAGQPVRGPQALVAPVTGRAQ